MNRLLKRRQLKCELLETRRLLAADMYAPEMYSVPATTENIQSAALVEAVDNDLSYEVDGHEIGLSIHPSRLAIATPPQSQFGWEKLPGELQLVRSLDNGISVFESKSLSSDQLEAALRMFPGVETTSSVFLVEETKTEAALLDQVVVSLNAGVSTSDLQNAFPAIESIEPLLGTPDQHVVTLTDSIGVETLRWNDRLDESKLVARSAPNFYQDWQRFYTPNDPRFGTNQWHLDNTGQGGGVAGEDSSLVEAWDVQQGGSSDIVIAIFDDGVQTDHPDLNVWENTAEAAGNIFTDDDNNGWLNDVNGWNFVNDNAQTSPTAAGDNHGTAVAGVAAAIGDNAVGVAGASYGSPVMVGRLFDGSGVSNDAEIATAFYYFAGRTADGTGTWDSADLVNNSWGGGAPSALISDALIYATTEGNGGAGMPIMFATGNGGFDAVSYPANLTTTIPGVVAVGAHTNSGVRSGYSQYGPDVDLVTPSNGGSLAIDTTDRTGADGYNGAEDYTGTGGTGFGGTSSASPLATGIAALLLARADTLGITLSGSDVRDLMRANTDLIGIEGDYEIDSGKHYEYGFGRLNAHKLVAGVGTAEISVTSTTQDLESGVDSAEFGQIILGNSAQMSLRIRNQGTEDLTISDITIDSAEFSIDDSQTQMTLGAGEWTSFIVNAEPTAGGTQTATVSITSNDTDEETFDVDVIAEVAIPSIAGTIFEDGNADGTHSGGETSLSGFSVFLDGNSNGIFDAASETFENTTQIEIPDAGQTTSSLEVSGLVGNIFDVDVGLSITHTFDSDLIGTLIAPDGTRVELFNRVGGGGDNFTDTVFDDAADTSINDGSAPFTGSFRPEEPLASFAGDANGTWTFEISDNAGLDTGTLDNWSLTIVTGEDSVPVDELGQFALLNLPAGDYSALVIPDAGGEWPTVTPASGAYDFTINNPEDSFPGSNFGLAKVDRFYAQVFEDTDGNGDVDNGETSLPDWDIFLDADEDGEYDPPTETSIVNETDVPIASLATASSTISTAGVNGLVADVKVRLEITHTWTPDLDVTLVSPDGTRVVLFDDVGLPADEDFTGTMLDDDADTPITEGTAPFTGTFRPENPLSGFDGALAAGDWTLEIFDDANGDSGTLLEWELILDVATEPLAPTNDGGFMAMDLATGTHKLQLVAPEGWEFTVPADGALEATTNGTPITSQLFGARPLEGESGDITEDTVWDNTDEPYRLIGDVRVRNGATLTIADGVIVETIDPEFELQIGTDTEVGTLDAGEADFGAGLLVQPGSTANLDETSLTGNMVDILGTLWASEAVFDADLNTNPDSEINIRFSDFAPNQVFVFDSGATVINVTHNDFASASPDSVQAVGTSTDTVDLSRNWWGTSDSATIGSFILDRLDDAGRPLIEFVEPLTVLYALGDANGDGALTNIDIGAFLLALTNRSSYIDTYPDVDPDIVLDMNWNGSFGNTDIAGFLNKLTGG